MKGWRVMAAAVAFVAIAPWPMVAAPAGSDLILALPRDHFVQGEEILATLTFRDDGNPANSDWLAKLGEEQFLANISVHAQDDRGQTVADPTGWYTSENFDFESARSDRASVHIQAGTGSLVLNRWLRFDSPGVYTIQAEANKQRPVLNLTHPTRTLDSNSVTITIDPLTPVIEKAMLDRARASLSKRDPYNSGDLSPNDDVCQELDNLVCLQTPAAIDLLLPYLSEGNNEVGRHAFFGLIGARDPKAAGERLLHGVENGKPLLNEMVLRLYEALSTYGFPGKGHMLGAVFYQNGKPIETPFSKAAEAAGNRIILAAIRASGDRGRIAASAYWARFQQHPQDPAVRAALVRHRLDLTANQRAWLIAMWSGEIASDEIAAKENSSVHRDKTFQEGGPDLLPVLRQAVEEDANPYALNILCHVAPEEARPLVIADIARKQSRYLTKPNTIFSWPLGLDALPDKPIPELTAIFRAKLREPDIDPQMILPLIDRYGAQDLLPDVLRFYQPKLGTWPCDTEDGCLRFWIKYQPEKGIAALEKSLQARTDTRCFVDMLTNVFKDRWVAQAQPVLLKALDDRDPEVVLSALKTLTAYGDTTTIAPSIAALQRIETASPFAGPDARPVGDQRYHEAAQARDMLASKRWTFTVDERSTLEKIAASWH